MTVLVTGSAGFIGFHTSLRLLKEGYDVVGFDNVNNYYDVRLKHSRLEILKADPKFTFYQASLEDMDAVNEVFNKHKPDYVINLAAQAGVRYSLEHPHTYIQSNIIGFLNILEACRNHPVRHLVYASSSSVYGGNTNLPFSTADNVDHPISLYAATKKSNELMAHTYSHLFRIPTTGLRFFTVYGPYGRPDMALFLFTKAILAGKPINVFNNGDMVRDFTYVDDIVEGIYRVMLHVPEAKEAGDATLDASSSAIAPYKVYNIGNNNPVKLEKYISVLEEELGKKAIKNYMPLQAGDVPRTFADVSDLQRDVGFKPDTSVEEGIHHFVEWYLKYYMV